MKTETHYKATGRKGSHPTCREGYAKKLTVLKTKVTCTKCCAMAGIGMIGLLAAVASCKVPSDHVTRTQLSDMGMKMRAHDKQQAELQAKFYTDRLELIMQRHEVQLGKQAKSCDLMRQGVHALASSHKGKNRASRLVDEACEVLGEVD